MMNQKELGASLVGSTIEFRIKDSENESTLAIIDTTRSKIESEVEKAISVGGTLCVMFLAELTDFYRRESYYMMIRSSIKMKRYRPMVLDYLKLSVDERAKRIQKILASSTHRDLRVLIAKYFFKVYRSRFSAFTKLFNREERIEILS